jgi:hypothetical protein
MNYENYEIVDNGTLVGWHMDGKGIYEIWAYDNKFYAVVYATASRSITAEEIEFKEIEDYINRGDYNFGAWAEYGESITAGSMPFEKEYVVLITSTATVSQTQTVKAHSKEEAEEIALNSLGDHVWDYEGAEDEGAEIVSISEVK